MQEDTLYDAGSVLRRWFSAAEVVQCCGGGSVRQQLISTSYLKRLSNFQKVLQTSVPFSDFHRVSPKKVSIKNFDSDLFIILTHSFMIFWNSADL